MIIDPATGEGIGMNTRARSDLDIVELSIPRLQEGFAGGRFAAEDVTRAHLARIERYEPHYNAFTSLNRTAIEDAKAIDARRAAGEALGPLAGIPVVVKEAIDIVGLPSTIGWAPLSSKVGGIDLMPENDAPVVARLRAAGAIILGKTNIPAFSYDDTRATSSCYGPTYNAVDRSLAPGASSSGTATAVAASFAVVGIATETGGSIQNPAAAQSLVSVKPTFGLIPNTGVAPLAGSTRDVVGPHARNAVDAAILLDALAGYTVEDPKTVASIGRLPVGGYAAALDSDALVGARLGLYGAGWRKQALSDETTALYNVAKTNLRTAGAALIEDPFAHSEFADIAVKIHGDDNRGLESVVYDFENYLRRLGRSSAANSLAGLKNLISEDPFAAGGVLGRYVESEPIARKSLEDPTQPPDLSGFLAVRLQYLNTFEAIMNRHNLMALAFPQSLAEIPGVFDGSRYPATTVSEINIAGLPGVTVPAGRYPNGSPFSLIFVGRMWSEAYLLSLAHSYEKAHPCRIVPQIVETAFV
ncbi:amidase [Mesorhizobium sp. B4-1-4]|uniref:amidase n=1 Tax=Mesorhizobium sp. B4-1-4 TaxID=2589888 RepID=UPI001D0032D5|nr:amidase [Mesorhizobium sp. B4-1-4]UCI31915.1 amidase [Mesorhizobium sp. B4-1-4]